MFCGDSSSRNGATVDMISHPAIRFFLRTNVKVETGAVGSLAASALMNEVTLNTASTASDRHPGGCYEDADGGEELDDEIPRV